MAWEKPVAGADIANASNADLQIRFYFSDGAAVPPNALTAELAVKVDRVGGEVDTWTVSQAVQNVGALSAAEKTQFGNLLAKLRDAGLQALGFVQV